jgi:hypothetical protein
MSLNIFVSNFITVILCFRDESLFMLLMYIVYCVALNFNAKLEQLAQALPFPCKSEAAHQGPPKPIDESSGLADGQRPSSYTDEKPQIMETNLGEAEEGQAQEQFKVGANYNLIL